MNRREFLTSWSEVAPGFKSLCRHSQPMTTVRLLFDLIARELPQTSSRAALLESGSQEKRSKSGLTIGKSCEVYPKVGGRLRLFSLFWDKFLSDQWIRDAVRGYKIEFKEIQFNTNYLTKCLSLETRKNVFQWRLENCWERRDESCVFWSQPIPIESIHNFKERRRVAPYY